MSDVRQAPLWESSLPFPLHARGKVRDMYDVGGDRLLMVASDRLSAFDVVMGRPIPSKGRVLTAVTVWWLRRLEDIVPTHLIAADADAISRAVPDLAGSREQWAGRSLLVRKTRPVPVGRIWLRGGSLDCLVGVLTRTSASRDRR